MSKLIVGVNDLKTKNPELAKEWNQEKNGSVTPSDVTTGSHKKVWWKCGEGHEWEAEIKSRYNGCGCPICGHFLVLKGYNDLETNNPELAKEWNYEKNGTITPCDVAVSSGKRFWWRCKHGHEWEATVNTRNSGYGCPVCSNRKVLKGYNDIESRYPLIAKEWNYERNKERPDEVLFGSGKKVWWVCKKCGYEWEAAPITRTRLLSGCPSCKNITQVSRPEKALAYYLIKAGIEIEENYKIYRNYTLDIYIPERKIAIEYDGQAWHKNIEKDLYKNQLCEKMGVTLFRVREPELKSLNSTSVDIRIERLSVSLDYMTEVIKKLFLLLNLNYSDIDAERDEIDIISFMHNYELNHSIARTNPELLSEWNVSRNQNLKPEFFSKGSCIKVWWKCTRGHDYYQAIAVRSRGSGCPYCSGKKVLKGFNDVKTKNPELLDEWNYKKNNDLYPDMVTSGSGKKVWWICTKGHEWQARIMDRTIHERGCPFCSGRLAIKGQNDFATTHPELLAEWDFKKNIIKPDEVKAGTNKLVWWKCKDCGNSFKAMISSRTVGGGCPLCGQKKRVITSRKHRIISHGSLADRKPILLKEWDFFRNTINPNEIELYSNIKVWWKCKLGHSYESTISNKVIGNGCPYCSNNKVLVGFNDLLTTHPNLSDEWNYNKNSELPSQFTHGSNKKVWWICPKGHEWVAVIRSRTEGVGCPICSGKQVLKGYNDLATVYPLLAKEWNVAKNINMTPDQFTIGSNTKVWWECDKGHEWEAAICMRTLQNTGCPYCTCKKILVGFNDLKTVYPKLAEEWNDKKNPLRPDEVVFGSGKRVWWKCPNCKNEWATSIVNRTRKKSGCPKCKYNWFKECNDNL